MPRQSNNIMWEIPALCDVSLGHIHGGFDLIVTNDQEK